LASKHAASELIFVAKAHLSKANRQLPISRLYFNSDLTQEEAKQAYLRRKERREKQLHSSATTSSSVAASDSVLNPAAPSFPTTDC